MRWILSLGSVVVLFLSLGSGALASTEDGTSPGTALPLSSKATIGLTGSPAGAFRYLQFNYPGNGSVGSITLNFSPPDPATANAVGLDLWQDGAMIGTMNGVSSTPGTNTLSFSSSVGGPILVQVFNYTNQEGVDFTVDLSGVSQPSPAPAAPTAPTAPPSATGTAQNPMSLVKPVSSTLPGNSAGSYAYFTLDYPGDGSTQSVTLSFSPNGPDVGDAVYVNVFQNGTQLVSQQASNTSTPGQVTVSYSSSVAGPVLIQLANFDPTTTISYTLSH